MKTTGVFRSLLLRRRWATAFLMLGTVAALGVPRIAQAQGIVNGGFEAGLTGWTTVDQVGSDGTFFVQTGTASPVNGFPVPPPPEGTQAAMTDAGAPGSHVLYQDFVVPGTVDGAAITFSLFINNGAENFFTPNTLDFAATNNPGGLNLNQQARVDIITTTADPFSVAGGDVLQNLFRTLPGDPLVSGYTPITADVSTLLQGFQGQTLRLRFAEVDNVSFFNLGVDNVSITYFNAAAAPEPSSLLFVGMMLVPLMALGAVRFRRRCRAVARTR